MKKALIGGKVYVEKGHFEEALFIEDGIIKAVGSTEEIKALIEAEEEKGEAIEVMDLEGATLIPGLNDSHMHITHIASDMAKPDTTKAKSIEHLIEICRDFAKENPQLTAKGIASTGWNQDMFTEGEKRVPTRHDLDRISTEVPVVLTRICGHSLVCNTKALEMAGITKDTPPVDGGTFEIGEDGVPTGFFTENAENLVKGLVPNPTPEEMKGYIVKAMEYALSKGLTSINSNDIGCGHMTAEEVLDVLTELYHEGKAPIRYNAQMTFETVPALQDYFNRLKPIADKAAIPNLFTFGPLKLFKDGSIGSHTALMRDEYLDDPGNVGVEVTDCQTSDELVKLAAENGMQVVTHAIGDRAIEEMIDSYEKTLKEGETPEERNHLRHGIVHFQCMDLELLERAARLGILALVQPVFLHADIGAVSTRFPKELNRYFLAFKTDLEKGIHLSFGSDSPVEDCNPFNSIYCGVNRKTLDGAPTEGFFPEESIDVETAVDCFTIGSAYAEFKEDIKGRLMPGYLADMVILDRDIFTCPKEELKDVKPLITMIGGKVVYKAE